MDSRAGDAAPPGEPALESTPMYPLEPAVPLSQSMVWHLQRTFYGDQGIAAWSRSNVPQSVTTSPLIARAYARIVLGFWRDMRATLDPSQPLYLVELGAGSGRFAFRFLQALAELLADSGEREMLPTFRYVMTDASPSVIQFWRDNARLRPFVERGVLDFAHFDLLDLRPLQLLNSGITLRLRELANPVVLIANYIFDSIPQDAYTISGGRLAPNLVTLSASTPELDLSAPRSSVKISITFSAADADAEPLGEADPLLGAILDGYRRDLDDTTVLIPRAAMACVRFFHDLGGDRGLCLIGDFGDTELDELRGHGPPGFGAGGGFWLPVNFHALGEYAVRLGGRARHPRQRHISLNVSMLLFDRQTAGFREANLAYADTIDRHGPDDLSVLSRALITEFPTLKPEAMLALLRTTGWDTDNLARGLPFLIEALPKLDARLHGELVRGAHQAWAQYYPIGESDDVPFSLGVLLYSLAEYPAALEFFERSLAEFGDDPRTTVNIALTQYRLGRLPETLHWLDRTLALDPAHELAQSMRPSVAAELAERG